MKQFCKTKIKIYGDVQGVFFRVSAEEKARELGIVTHETNNMPDGTVEIIVSGETDKTEKIPEFIEWCKVGPELARVEKVEVARPND